MTPTRVRVLSAIGVAAVAALLAGSAPAAKPPRTAPVTKLQRLVRGLVSAGAPGAIVVVRVRDTVRSAVAGVGTIDPRTPLRRSDRYRIASVTKPFVATLVLQLAAEGRLALDEAVERWLPGLVPNGDAITLRELLNHTSGLFDYDEDADWVRARIADPAREWSPRELVAVAASHPPRFAPGSGWSYSNTNYVLLGLVVEAATGRSLGQELHARILDRLGLRSTSYPSGTAIEGPAAHGYVGSGSGVPIPAGTLLDVTSLLSPSAWGAGQMISTADDLTRFFRALFLGQLLAPPELRAMKTLVPAGGYGLGLRSAVTACGRAYGHDGDVPGYRNVVWALANGGRVAAIMVNVDTTYVSWSRLQAAAKTALCSG